MLRLFARASGPGEPTRPLTTAARAAIIEPCAPPPRGRPAMPPDPGSITRLIERLRGGAPEAARALWERFAERLLAVARRRLGGAPRRVADEEDVAVVAFERFLRGAREGRFPRLADRDDLWAILFTLTARQAAQQARDLGRDKRGGGEVRGDSALGDPAGAEPGPDDAAAVRDQLDRLLGGLKDDELRRIALGRLEGRSNAEIALLIGRSVVTVERRLNLVRETWRQLGLGETTD
jgi:DNA-directed RNA polymerase specialized sigma24 family protein